MGAWEGSSEALAAPPQPHPPHAAPSLTPDFQNTPFGILQLWASVSLYVKGLNSSPPELPETGTQPRCQRPMEWP